MELGGGVMEGVGVGGGKGREEVLLARNLTLYSGAAQIHKYMFGVGRLLHL